MCRADQSRRAAGARARDVVSPTKTHWSPSGGFRFRLDVETLSPSRPFCFPPPPLQRVGRASPHRSTLTCSLIGTAAARQAAESGREGRRGRPLGWHRRRRRRCRRRCRFALVGKRRKGGGLRHDVLSFPREAFARKSCSGPGSSHSSEQRERESERERGERLCLAGEEARNLRWVGGGQGRVGASRARRGEGEQLIRSFWCSSSCPPFPSLSLV